jgi:hypothetical protein
MRRRIRPRRRKLSVISFQFSVTARPFWLRRFLLRGVVHDVLICGVGCGLFTTEGTEEERRELRDEASVRVQEFKSSRVSFAQGVGAWRV